MILCGPQFMIGAFVLTGVIWPEGCHIGFDGEKLQCFTDAEVKTATLVLSPPCAEKPYRHRQTEVDLAYASSMPPEALPPPLAALQSCQPDL